MKTFIIIYMLIQLASVASAEIFTWEDANGINFSDNPTSMPEEYREKVFEETRAQIDNAALPKKIGKSKQTKPPITTVYQTATYQAKLEQQRRIVAIKEQHARVLAVRAEINKDTFPSLATLVAVWLILALFLIIVWILTIADIARSDYMTPSIKTGWMLRVVFIPFIGMLLYYKLGLNQKSKPNSYNVEQQFKTFSPPIIRNRGGSKLAS